MSIQRIVFILFLTLLLHISISTVNAARPDTAAEKALKIQKEIAELRGKKFKNVIRVQNQSIEDFGDYLDRAILQQIPENLLKNYGKIVRKVGLYRGPEIADFAVLAKSVLQSQAAAYYDPAKNTFFVVKPDLPELALNAVYAHELYHGLQDQYHNLDAYLLSQTDRDLNDDEILARQAVVEGEATFVMTLWSFKNMLGQVPDAGLLRIGLKRQNEMDTAAMVEMLKTNAKSLGSGDLAKAVQDLEKVPRFMLETMISAYLKGMAFVFEIQQHGWEKVEELYSNAPVSTEQILHPEKWLANERPQKRKFSGLAGADLVAGWRVLETNTLGELQWRTVFAENALKNLGRSVAEGWNGDSYAVLENERNGDLLLLLWTAWDTVKDAIEFHEAYQRLLKIKYGDKAEVIGVERVNKTVVIVEGGKQKKLAERLAYLRDL